MNQLDHHLLALAYGGMHGSWALPMIALTALGGGWTALLLIPLAAWSRTRAWALALLVAVVIQAALVCGLKRACGRVRPWIALGLPPPIGTPSDYSFPSGHAAGSFCVALFVVFALRGARASGAARATWTHGLSLGCLALAALIGWSRVYLGAHFPGDVAAGAALGGMVGACAGLLYARPLVTRALGVDGAAKKR